MLEIKVDDYTFHLSHRTLDRFPRTKLYRMLMGYELHSNFIEKKNSHYIVDADPIVFTTLVRLLRGVVFWDEHMNDHNQLSDLCILLDIDIDCLRDRNTSNTINNSPSDKELNVCSMSHHGEDIYFGENIFDKIPNKSIFPQINKKMVIRSRKIELDTHDEMINL